MSVLLGNRSYRLLRDAFRFLRLFDVWSPLERSLARYWSQRLPCPRAGAVQTGSVQRQCWLRSTSDYPTSLFGISSPQRVIEFARSISLAERVEWLGSRGGQTAALVERIRFQASFGCE